MAAEEDTEYLKLPVEERCVHKLWKARVSGYEEAVKLFNGYDNDEAAWKKFAPIVKKFVIDSNAVAQEKGLEAALSFVENSDLAGRQAGDIMDGLVNKCVAAPKTKTKTIARTMILMLVEIEQHERVIEELINGLKHKNPKVASGCMAAITECLRCFGAKIIKVSPLLKAAMPMLDHRDKTVREEGKQLIIESFRWVGAIMKQQLTGLKPVQLTELEAEFEKVLEAGKAKPERYLRSQMPTAGGGGGGGDADEGDGGDGEGAEDEEEEAMDPYDLMDPVDILPQLPKNFYELVEEKKWQLRKEALDALLPLSKTPKIVPGDFNDLVRVLKKMIAKDTNVMIVALAAQCFAGIAKGLRGSFKNHAQSSLSVILEKFKEKKTNVVAGLVEAVDALYPTLDIEAVQEDCLAALKHKTPTVNTETAKFLARCFAKCPPKLVTEKKVLKGYVSALVEKLAHPDANVREACAEALGVLMKFLGEPLLMKLMPDLDNIKLTKVKEFCEKAELSGKPAAAMAPKAAPKPAAKAATVTKPKAKVVKPEAKSASASKPASASSTKSAPERKVSRPGVSRPGTAKAAPASSRKKGEDVDLSAPYIASNLKNVRFKEEAKLKVLKWNFATPRPEFVEQLQEQMTTASLNSTLQTQLFHKDFKQHLKAIEMLSKYLDEDSEALIANLDLILKWVTLRFFETNPSVLLKSLEYLNRVFASLVANEYHLHDIEAVSFVPYLINKVGDPKDQVRNSIKSIIKILFQVYPASKMSVYLMDGLKSKNAKQRAECLDELGHVVSRLGSGVLQPSPGACLKEIAKQIAERDTHVRNAALNTITEVYFQDGEKIYKALGNLPEKDMAMLEERIKRTSKSRPPPKSASSEPPSRAGSAAPAPASNPTVRPGASNSRLVRPNTAGAPSGVNMRQQQQQLQNGGGAPPSVRNNASPAKSRPISGAFTLDLDKIEAGVENLNVGPGGVRLVNHNLDDIFNDGPIALPNSGHLRARTAFNSPPSAASSATPPHHRYRAPNASDSSPPPALTDMPEAYEALDVVLAQVFNQDTDVCINALMQLDDLIKDSEKVELLGARMDQLLVSCYMQYRHVLSTKMKTDNYDGREVLRIFQYLTTVLMSLFHHAHLTKKASTSALHDILHVIICILLEPAVQELPQGAQLVRALNVLTVKIVERSDHTAVTSAFIKLLKDGIGNASLANKYIELVMKCLWKVIRSMNNWNDDLNVDLILGDLHDFFVAYPSSFWKSQPSDIPVRTVKTILHTLVKLRGDEILDHLSRVSEPESSEMVHYLKKLLTNGVGKENNAGSANGNGEAFQSNIPKKNGRGPRFTKSDHEALAEIFKKIGDKEKTKEGLQELYNFKQSNPQADLEPFLAKSSQYFRDYIERGLKNIDAEGGNVGGTKSAAPSNRFGSVLSDTKENATLGGPGGGGNAPAHSTYMDRLRRLREQAGLDAGKAAAAAGSHATSQSRTASSSSSSMSAYRISSTSSSSSVVTSSEMADGPLTETTENLNKPAGSARNVDDIRKRLEMIKQSAAF